MAVITYREALRQALEEEMHRDKNVILLGEEVAQYNGAYKVSKGLLDEFGEERVIDTPITEEGFTGVAIGAAMAGMRPVVEWMTFNFSIQAMDQVFNNAAKMLYMSGGQFNIPIVFRGPNGPAEYLASQHSQALASIYAHFPGLKVVAPATPYDAKGLLKSAIRDDNPVVFMEAELIYAWEGDVPEEEYLIEIGKADLKKEGDDVSIITFGKPLQIVTEAADVLEKKGIHADILDLRSLRPLDEEAILKTVKKTNRAVIVDESWPVAGMASHIGWIISHKAFDFLDAPVELVTSEDVPMPYNHTLELAAQPSVDKIVQAVQKVMYIREA
ncbi:pyruvate dehydrogenase complex E1 component subunit beta [Fidelibacter multiformis]|jgi:pyruvate dehydrogenase E1 component beta subunit|uniref:pyruvate dehydrogenase complex E1 component subunit beta n=1 Tax=Fidelibacter multiformis TaxID=3377529 RepID=UPI0037DCE761